MDLQAAANPPAAQPTEPSATSGHTIVTITRIMGYLTRRICDARAAVGAGGMMGMTPLKTVHLT